MKRVLTIIYVSLLFTSLNAQFTSDNLVVYRVGNGSTALSSAGAAVNLVEYAQTGTATGFNIALPTTGASSISAAGSSTSEGFLSLSSNGQYIMAAGYRVDVGTASVIGSTANAPRVVLRVNASGSYDITTQLAYATNYDAGNIRSSTSDDGTNIWTGGTTTVVANAGVRYTTLGGNTSTQLVSTTTNIRVVNIFSGQLYYSTGSGTPGIYAVGTGLPTTSGQAATGIVAYTSGSPYGFAFLDADPNVAGVDLLYIADDGTTTKGLRKYSYDGSTWTSRGIIATSISVRGLCAKSTAGGYAIYTTDGANLYSFVDNTGATGTITGSLTSIATAGTNYAFRGVCFTPGTTIPVELVDFKAQKQNTAVKLAWSTATELNNAFYAIERSDNGKSFEKIGEVAGYGNSQQARSYTFMDEKPMNTVNYYRLRQVDFDGKETVYKTVFIGFSSMKV